MKSNPKGKQPTPESLLKDADYNRKSELEQSFKFFKRINDPRFGDISIIQNPQSREFLAVREKKINDRAEAGRNILAARQRATFKNPYVLELKDYSVTKQSELCSSFYIIKFFYEYPRSDLRKEIQEKQRNGTPFSHVELTHLFYQQIIANSYLQSKDQTHGDIQPLHIGWDRETLVSKLIDRYEEPGNALKTKQIQKNRLIAGHNLYQSPTMYANLKKGNLNFNFDPAKEDAFALGLVLLEAGNGQSIQNIYDSSKGTVDQVVLTTHVNDFNKRFGADNALLASSVSSLVTFDESSRPTARQIEGSIPTYESVRAFLGENQNGQAVQLQGHGLTHHQQQQAPKEHEPALFNFESAKNDSNPYMIETKPVNLFSESRDVGDFNAKPHQAQSTLYDQHSTAQTSHFGQQNASLSYNNPQQTSFTTQTGNVVYEYQATPSQTQEVPRNTYYSYSQQPTVQYQQAQQQNITTDSQTQNGLTHADQTQNKYAKYTSNQNIAAPQSNVSYSYYAQAQQPIVVNDSPSFRKGSQAVQTIYENQLPTTQYVTQSSVLNLQNQPVQYQTIQNPERAQSYSVRTQQGTNVVYADANVQQANNYYVQNETTPLRANSGQSEARQEYQLSSALNNGYSTRVVQTTTPLVQYRKSSGSQVSFPSIQYLQQGNDYSQSERKQSQWSDSNRQERVVVTGQTPSNRVIRQISASDLEVQGLKLIGSYTDFSTAKDAPNY